MDKLSKELIVKLSKDLMFELTSEEIEDVFEASASFMKHVDVLQAINVEGVEVMSYPVEHETVWMRSDDASRVIEQKQAFKNAPRVEGDYFEVVKVVQKHD